MIRPISWIQRELTRHFPTADFKKGVDLNHNGYLESNERLYKGGWQAFLQRNHPAMIALGGIFEWGKELKPDNPIHDILSLESELSTTSQIRGAYAFIQASLKFSEFNTATTAVDRLTTAFERTHRFGFVYAYDNIHLFSAGIDKSRLDCDTMSFYILAIGHEKNWPVEIIDIPAHTYIRWDDHKGARINFDLGDFRSDAYYEDRYKASRSRVYPMVLDRAKLLGHVYYNRGLTRIERGDSIGAIADFTGAIQLNPNDCTSFNARGVAYMKQQGKKGREKLALADFDRAIQLNPGQQSAIQNRAELLSHMASMQSPKLNKR